MGMFHSRHITKLSLAVVSSISSSVAGQSINVDSAVLFNPTGTSLNVGQVAQIQASGTANLADRDGPYTVGPDGVIVVAPPLGSGAYNFFTSSAGPIGIPPAIGNTKILIPPYTGQLDGVPYGALVAGISPLLNPVSLADFPNGFVLVGSSGSVTAITSGYLFLAVNDINNTDDNSGAYSAIVTTGCHVAIAPTGAAIGVFGGSGDIVVTTTNQCSWTATSNPTQPWIKVTSIGTQSSSPTVSGSNLVTYTVNDNAGGLVRKGTISISDQTFVITQAGTSTCSFKIKPSSQDFPLVGGTGTITVTAQLGCAWTAHSNGFR